MKPKMMKIQWIFERQFIFVVDEEFVIYDTIQWKHVVSSVWNWNHSNFDANEGQISWTLFHWIPNFRREESIAWVHPGKFNYISKKCHETFHFVSLLPPIGNQKSSKIQQTFAKKAKIIWLDEFFENTSPALDNEIMF